MRKNLTDKLKCLFGRHSVLQDCALKMYEEDDIETNCIKCNHKLLLKNDNEDSSRYHVIEA